jgi:hypothetical protein
MDRMLAFDNANYMNQHIERSRAQPLKFCYFINSMRFSSAGQVATAPTLKHAAFV